MVVLKNEYVLDLLHTCDGLVPVPGEPYHMLVSIYGDARRSGLAVPELWEQFTNPEQAPVQWCRQMTMLDLKAISADHLVSLDGTHWMVPGTPYRALLALHLRGEQGGAPTRALYGMWVIFQKDLSALTVSYV